VCHDISSFASAGGIKISSVFCAPLATRTPANPTRLRGSKVFELDEGPTTGMSHLTKSDRYGFTTGTELAFSRAASVTEPRFLLGGEAEILPYATAIFRQVNKNEQFRHHDALEFPMDALFS
jgi:hypothetical protein